MVDLWAYPGSATQVLRPSERMCRAVLEVQVRVDRCMMFLGASWVPWIQGSLMLGRQGVEELSRCPEPSDSLFSKSVLPQTGMHRSCFGVGCLGCPRLGAEVAKLLWPSSTTGAFQGMQLSWVPSTEVEQQLYSL